MPDKSRSTAALASAVVPGLGQIYVGKRGLGSWLLLIDVALLVAAGLGFTTFRLEVVKLWVSPPALALLMAANLAVLFYRWLAVSDAYHSIDDRTPPRRRTAARLIVTGMVLFVPHLAFGYLTVTQYSLIDSVFADEVVLATGSEGELAVAPEPAPSGGVAAVGDDTDTATEPGQTPAGTSRKVPRVSPLWDGRERLNILLLGADSGEGRRGTRTDTSILVSVDPETGDAGMFSVPRDLSGAPLPTGMGVWGCDCFPDLITHLYDAAEQHPEAFPGPQSPPINGLKAAFGEILGLEVHYYAMVTLEGFVDIVDSLGGVTMDVPVTIWDDTYPHEDGTTVAVRIEEGTRHLNGHEALAYARIRRHSSDFNRMSRQRCLLGAIAEQTSPAEVLLRFGAIAEALKRSLDTDIPEALLPDLIDLLPKLSTDRIATLRITREVYKNGEAPGRTYYDTDQIREDVRALLANPETAYAKLGLKDLGATCGVEQASAVQHGPQS